jgi:hypothetical protein
MGDEAQCISKPRYRCRHCVILRYVIYITGLLAGSEKLIGYAVCSIKVVHLSGVAEGRSALNGAGGVTYCRIPKCGTISSYDRFYSFPFALGRNA